MPRFSPETCKTMTTLTVLIAQKWSCGYKTLGVSIHSVCLISFPAEECVGTIQVFFKAGCVDGGQRGCLEHTQNKVEQISVSQTSQSTLQSAPLGKESSAL